MLWHCTRCTTAYARDLDRCPNCGAAERSDHPQLGSSAGGPAAQPAATPAGPPDPQKKAAKKAG